MTEVLEVQGVVAHILGNNNYRVKVEIGGTEREILCHMGGRMRQFKINVIPGDEVTVQIPYPYDKGRITFRGIKPIREEGAPREKSKARRGQR